MTKEPTPMRVWLWLPSLALLALGACASDDQSPKLTGPTPTEHYSIEVKPAPQELQLATHAGGLSPNQVDALHQFLGDWEAADRGDITIKAPEHGSDPAGAYRTATDVRDFLSAQGVKAARVHIEGYEAQGDPKAPVLVGFMRYVAKGPHCGDDWDNVSVNYNNEAYKNFGCALTANVAAQISDPADLLTPRGMTPPDAQRRATQLDKYRQGVITTSEKSDQADGTVSSVGK